MQPCEERGPCLICPSACIIAPEANCGVAHGHLSHHVKRPEEGERLSGLGRGEWCAAQAGRRQPIEAGVKQPESD